MIREHLKAFGGFEIQLWTPDQVLADPERLIYRIATEFDSDTTWPELFQSFLASTGREQVQGLVIGFWDVQGDGQDPIEVIQALTDARDLLLQLKTLFIGDIISEENEISWINNGDLSSLLAAYPELQHLGIRGGSNLSLGQIDLPDLRSLIIQSGGLSVETVREVMNSHLPQLEHLELYLGTQRYGASSQIDDLKPILNGQLFPKLTYLGLKNSDYQDQIAQAVAQAPVLERLETLDLSLGTLTDEGAQALLHSGQIKRLKKLDLNHHFCSEAMISKLRTLDIQLEAQEAPDYDRDGPFVAIGE